MKGGSRPPLRRNEIAASVMALIGFKTLCKLASGKSRVVILFYVLTRPTLVFRIVPYVIEALEAGTVSS
jgi:nickel-dependent lactate racemase